MTINVLYVSNSKTFLGGAEKCLYELLSHLDPLKINPTFASIYDDQFANSIKNLGIHYIKLNEFSRKNPFPYIYSQIQLIHLILKNRILIIHNNQCKDAFYSWFPAFLTKTKIIIHHRDSSFGKLDRFFISHVDINISISNWQNKEFLNNKGLLIHDGIDLEKVPKCNEYASKKISYLPQKKLSVGLVGRIQPIKGQHVFIDSAKIVLDKIPDINFFIIGDTNSGYQDDYLLNLRSQINTLRIENNVILNGFVKDVDNIYPELDIIVVPSIREAFGMVIIEAMAFCKPVIATSVGGAIDIVTDQTGILIPVNDPHALANAILYLAENPLTRLNMGKSGRKRVEENFTINGTLSKVYKLYEKFIIVREK